MTQVEDQSAATQPGSMLGRQADEVRSAHTGHSRLGSFRLDLGRSLRLHRALAAAIAFAGLALAILYYFAAPAVYLAQADVHLQPSLPEDPQQGAAMPWRSGAEACASELRPGQQPEMRTDVLAAALGKLTGWERSGETAQAAVERLRRSVAVSRSEDQSRLTISARASGAVQAAQMANAVAGSCAEALARDRKTADALWLTLLREERDRIQAMIAAEREEQEALAKWPAKRAVAPSRGRDAADNRAPRDEFVNHRTAPGAPAFGTEPRRSKELVEAIARLQSGSAALDEQLSRLELQDADGGSAARITEAAVPALPLADTKMRNALLIALAGVFLALLAALAAQKMDPGVYVAADAEKVLGFPPVAQIPEFGEVSEADAEEHLLRFAAALEHGHKQGRTRSWVFTGASPGSGVTTLIVRVRATLEAMGRPTVVLDASRIPSPNHQSSDAGAEGQPQGVSLVTAEHRSRTRAMLQQMDENGARDAVVLADAAPLAASAETELLARFADGAVVVIESGVTTRAQVQEAACILRRLRVGAVEFVVNRVALAKADAEFTGTMQAIPKRRAFASRSASRRNGVSGLPEMAEERAEPIRPAFTLVPPVEPANRPPLPGAPSHSEAELDARTIAAQHIPEARTEPHVPRQLEPILDSTGQDSTAQDSRGQDSTAQYSRDQDSTVQDSTVQESTFHESALLHSTVPDSTVLDSTVLASPIFATSGSASPYLNSAGPTSATPMPETSNWPFAETLANVTLPEPLWLSDRVGRSFSGPVATGGVSEVPLPYTESAAAHIWPQSAGSWEAGTALFSAAGESPAASLDPMRGNPATQTGSRLGQLRNLLFNLEGEEHQPVSGSSAAVALPTPGIDRGRTASAYPRSIPTEPEPLPIAQFLPEAAAPGTRPPEVLLPSQLAAEGAAETLGAEESTLRDGANSLVRILPARRGQYGRK